MGTVRLNLGSGVGEHADAFKADGWTNIDRKMGTECYPLADVDDGTVDEIRASHVLEHFGHREVVTVLTHWVAKLKPGGIVRIAVPNFKWIAEQYLAGVPINTQGYTFGGQTDDDDFHAAGFDREALTEIMAAAGLSRITEWKSDTKDCSALECSLNLQGQKPLHDATKVERVHAVLCTPRYGPTLHARCNAAMVRLGIPLAMYQGCFWDQMLSEAMEDVLETGDYDFILTLDYDTVYGPDDVLELYRTMLAFPDIDALCSVQSKRGGEHILFGLEPGPDGKPRPIVYKSEFRGPVKRIRHGHFGLTMIRAATLAKLPRPWMNGTPDKDGRWRRLETTDGSSGLKVDPDITFWRAWEKAGFTLCLANRVVVGHLEEVVTWPDHEFKPVRQDVADYFKTGKPVGVQR
jgi:hypothetical protein